MNKPHSPERAATARDRILDAAEAVFAADGFSGSGMKAIATRAGVAQGLLHDHFDNKDGLYSAVIARRASAINAERLRRLEAVNLEAPDAVTRIMEALLRPPLGPAGGGHAYARIFGNMLVGGPREAVLVSKLYDPTARQFIKALERACPDARPATVSWGYHMAISALAGTLARSDRPERLIGKASGIGASPHAETEASVRRLVRFAVGGLLATVEAETDKQTVT